MAFTMDFSSLDDLMQKIELALDKGDTKRANQMFTAGILAFKDDPEIWLNYGKFLTSINDFDEALKMLNNAIKLKDDYSEAFIGLGMIYKMKKDMDKALETYKKLVELYPDNTNYLQELADLHLRMKNKDEAIKLLEQSFTIPKKSNEQIMFKLAMAYSERKDYKKTDELFGKLIALPSYKSEVYFSYGQILIIRDEKEKALEMLQKAVEINPINIDAQDTLSKVFMAIGNFEKSAEIHEFIVKLDPYSEKHWQYLAGLYKKLGKNDLFERTMKRATTNLSNNPNVFLNQAYAALQKGDANNAILNAIKAKEKNPWYVQANIFLADIYRRLNDHKNALKFYEMVADTVKGPFIMLNLGICNVELGNYKKAVEYLEEVLEVVRDNTTALENLGKSYMKLNKFAEAAEAFKELRILKDPDNASNIMDQIKFEKNFSSITYNLALALKKAGQIEEAFDYFKQCPDFAVSYQYHYQIADIFYQQGKFEDALIKVNQALEINPSAKEPKKLLKRVKKSLKKK